MTKIEKLNKIAKKDTQWLKEAKERQVNRSWQKHSQKIAIKILRTLREKGIKQKELAEMLGVSAQQVSKIVKGKENFTLESIAKIEAALEIDLLFGKEQQTIYNKTQRLEKQVVYMHVYSNYETFGRRTTLYKHETENYPEKGVNSEDYYYG